MTEIDRGKRWREDQIQLGLGYLAMHGGKSKKAEQALVEDGHERVPASTLHEWKTKHVERYDQLRELALDQYNKEATHAFAAIREKALDVAGDILRDLVDKHDKVSPDALGRTMKELTIAAATASDKAQVLQGRPSEITRNQTLVAAIGAMMHHGVVGASPEEVAAQVDNDPLKAIYDTYTEMGLEPKQVGGETIWVDKNTGEPIAEDDKPLIIEDAEVVET